MCAVPGHDISRPSSHGRSDDDDRIQHCDDRPRRHREHLEPDGFPQFHLRLDLPTYSGTTFRERISYARKYSTETYAGRIVRKMFGWRKSGGGRAGNFWDAYKTIHSPTICVSGSSRVSTIDITSFRSFFSAVLSTRRSEKSFFGHPPWESWSDG